jgi:hypothetical protein
MELQEQQNVPLVSYVSAELLSRVQQAARTANRSVAGQVRDILERHYNDTPKRETR